MEKKKAKKEVRAERPKCCEPGCNGLAMYFTVNGGCFVHAKYK